MATLQKLVSLKPTLNEIERKLEQLRFLDNGYKIKISKFNINIPPGIDTEDDVKTAIKYINNES
jgi:3-deoxy-manno-octulosonate cytidylyltransferase (CMP-KDO synthetase)